MHKEIFSKNQFGLLPLMREFRREFHLVGRTAIALYLGHRRSIDFDMFKYSAIHPAKLISKVSSYKLPYVVTRRVSEQLNLIIKDVTFTFFEYPFRIEAKSRFEDIFRLPSLLDLAAMKAYAPERRSKWKDYVDFYFLLRDHFTIGQITDRSVKIFGQLFSQKLFRAQVCFFNDKDYSEPVEFLSKAPSRGEIQQFLIDKAIDLDN